jgi:monovalent cation:H+ antiporter-2, CPA2 family
MPHETELIATIAIGLSAAFVGGVVATWLRLPTIVGYLLAGMAVGPFTPGFVADQGIATQLAEIGVVLLLFGVGMHFSIPELLSVRGVAIPGGIGQAAVATALGVGIGTAWGWAFGEALVFGLAVSVASTVVLLRALTDRDRLDTSGGHVAVGWLLVEDLLTVVMLVALPVLSETLGGVPAEGGGGVLRSLLPVLGKLVAFAAVMLLAGPKLIPPLLRWTERRGGRELFTLAVIAIALGIAFLAAELLDVPIAIAAFLAGVVVNRSDLSHRAMASSEPLQDIFAVLFFVSVGMLVDPAFLLREWDRVLIVVALIVVGKALIALGLVLVLRRPLSIGLTVAAGLSQVGEFSFILAELGRELELIGPGTQHLILAGALFSITVNPLVFAIAGRIEDRRSAGTVTAPKEVADGQG